MGQGLGVREEAVDPLHHGLVVAGHHTRPTRCHYAGSVSSPEEFLEQLGVAPGDPRPIVFAIVPTPDAEAAFEVTAEPTGASGELLAHTVGEALALRYWTYLAGRSERLRQRTDAEAREQLAGLETGAFPADFRGWWADYARTHRLPPQPR